MFPDGERLDTGRCPRLETMLASRVTDAIIFIVDDDEAVRDSLKLLLELHGLTVEDYGSTGEFARHLGGRRRGCLVLDQHLPITSGLDFLASPAGREIGLPVILITGRGDETLRDRARQLGVLAYFEKPVAEGALLAAIDQALDNGGLPAGDP